MSGHDYEITYHGHVDGATGKFVPDEPVSFRNAFRIHYKKRVTVTIDREHEIRSDAANRYYMGVVVTMIAKAMGERDKEEVHRTLKKMFNYREVVSTETGEVLRLGKSTKKMSPEAFWNYVEQCRQWAAEFFSLYIPDPNEGMTMVEEDRQRRLEARRQAREAGAPRDQAAPPRGRSA
jgi:hypothetical protein